MIYLIDDKISRQQNDYRWTNEKLNKYKAFIEPIYTINELRNKSKEIFIEGNVILYHESFLDKTDIQNEAAERRSKLEIFAKDKSSFLVFFSGSTNTRDLIENSANLPVSVLYNNLEIFINHFSQGEINLEYLLFGENPKIEKELSDRLEVALLKTSEEEIKEVQNNNLIIRPSKHPINKPLINYSEEIIFNTVTDDALSEKVNLWLNKQSYDNIFIPLCFGGTLSDYNGLKLACHIRCTPTKNQTTTIYIYSFVGIEYLIHNEFFNILSTKNVKLIPFSKYSIFESSQMKLEKLMIDELPYELNKLKIEIPKNYYDNHAIANEWGIYQMARNSGLEIEEIEGFNISKLSSLYFKWLIAKNELFKKSPDDQTKKLREYTIKISGPNFIGKIDLDKIPKR